MAVPFVIEREMGCTRADFMRWLAGATRGAPACFVGGAGGIPPQSTEQPKLDVAEAPHRSISGASTSSEDEVKLAVGGGRVEISLREEAPRRIALISIPVLRVRFRFVGLGGDARDDFMAHFDDYTRRGGG